MKRFTTLTLTVVVLCGTSPLRAETATPSSSNLSRNALADDRGGAPSTTDADEEPNDELFDDEPAEDIEAIETEEGLADTTWVGTEDLQNFGRLELRFEEDGKVIMIDAAGEQGGTFTRDGDSVTLSFFEGRVTYTGTIDGTMFSGTARNSNDATWNFEVSK